MIRVFILFASFALLWSCDDREELFEMTYETDVAYSAGISQFQIHFQDMFGIDTMSK